MNEILNGMNFNNRQEHIVYEEYLKPIKLKILQILLYDSQKASELLNDYNEIIKDNSQKAMDMINKINNLEAKLEEYEKGEGAKLKLKEQERIIYDTIEDLENKSYQLSVEEFIDAFLKLRKIYNGIEHVNLEDLEKISIKFHELQAILIQRIVKENKNIDLDDILQENDKAGLQMFIIQKINQLLQLEDKDKNRAQKIRNIMMTDKDWLYSKQLWQLMEGTEHSVVKYNSDSLNRSTALEVIPKQRNDKVPFIEIIRRLFERNPKLPLQIADLKKINIDWLAEQIPESMLEEIEKKALEKEERKNVDKMFMPDSKTPIYDFFSGSYDWFKEEVKSGWGFHERIYQTKYIDDYGIEKEVTIDTGTFEQYVVSSGGATKTIYNGRFVNEIRNIVKYTTFLDRILGTNLTRQLLCEIEKGHKKLDKNDFHEKIYVNKKKSKMYENLRTSFKKIKKQCENTEIDFRGCEEKRRKDWYQRYSFKEDIIFDEKGEQTVIPTQEVFGNKLKLTGTKEVREGVEEEPNP